MIVSKEKKEIKRKYTESGQLFSDSQKSMWGSEESMLNRFRLALDQINWDGIETWLDIGCGTGRFFEYAENQGKRAANIIGIDLTSSMIDQARHRKLDSPTRFEVADLESMPNDICDVSLITMIGVLQLCGCPLQTALNRSLSKLTPGGQIFLTTKHLGWLEFKREGVNPDPGHSWFLIEEVRQAVLNCGVEINNDGGFMPREGKIVSPEEAHTLFVYGKKKD